MILLVSPGRVELVQSKADGLVMVKAYTFLQDCAAQVNEFLASMFYMHRAYS